MSIEKISIKHNKHRLYHCPQNKKLLLLKTLLEQNNSTDILIAAADNIDELKQHVTADNITLLCDTEIINEPEKKYGLVISYDLPSEADIYISRAAKALNEAIILFDADERERLYKIETSLKRAIRQEHIKGFEPQAKPTRPKTPKTKKDTPKQKYIKGKKNDSKKEKKPQADKKPQRKIIVKELKPKTKEASNP